MTKISKTIILMFIDAILVTGSVYVAYLLRFDFQISERYFQVLPYVITIYIALMLISFYSFKIYKRIWQYASVGDLISILKGALLGSVFFYTIHQFIVQYFYGHIVVPRSIYLLTTILVFMSVGGSRFLWRIFRDNYMKIQPHHRRALIVGAGEAGVLVVRELKHNQADLYPVAFIDDDLQKQKSEAMGVPIVGTRQHIPQIVKKYEIQDIIIALPSSSRTDIAEIINICKETNAQIKIIPRVNDLIHGKFTVNMIRDVSVEDLLGREPVKVDMDGITGYLREKAVLVTGAGGSIGSEICRQVANVEPNKLILLGHGENSIYQIEMELKRDFPQLSIYPMIADVQDRARLEDIFATHKPDVVFHAAAHKHVPLMEQNPVEAVKNNILGTKHVAECADAIGTDRFVLISTDKAVNPTSVMGATKRVAEMVIQNMNAKSKTSYAAVRFGNVLGSRGSVIPLFKKQIAQGGPVTVTHPEMIRYFMTIPEAVQLVIQAGAYTEGGETFILDMGKPVKIADLAHDLIRLSGLEPGKDIEVQFTGMRPGEKLYEELLTNEEGAIATKHDRIFVGKHGEIIQSKFERNINAIEVSVKSGDQLKQSEMKVVLQEMIPSYQSSISESKLNHIQIQEKIKASMEVVATLERKLN